MMLSLGAPFWLDALKNLAKLRPILAGRVQGRYVRRPSSRVLNAKPK